MNPGSEDKPLSDPSYNARDFGSQLLGGSLRWLATVLAVASLGLLIFFFMDKEEPEMHFPIHLKGTIVLWVVGLALMTWSLLAIMNWKNWRKRRSQQ